MAEWIITNCESVGNTHDICQDHTEYMESNKVHVGALADGLSSNKYSNVGATFVTQIACQEMCANFADYYSGKLTEADFVNKIKSEIGKRYNPCDVTQMKSTLLLCAIRKDKYILGHIGDGAILCFGKNSCVISQPQENEVGGTATYTILDYNADEHFKFIKGTMDDKDGFLLTSDGLSGNVYYSGIDIPQLAFELFGSVYKSSSPVNKKRRDDVFKEYLAEHIQKGNEFADDCSLYMIARSKKTGYVDYEIQNGFEADVKWPCKCGHYNRMDEVRCSHCRMLYISLYSSEIIDIASKEAFFSGLNKWIESDCNIPFDAGATAEILNRNAFDDICCNVKMNAKTKLESDVVSSYISRNNHGEAKASERVDSQVKRVQKEKQSSYGERNAESRVGIGIGNVAKFGATAFSRIKKGWQSINEPNDKHSDLQKKETVTNDRVEIQKYFPISVSFRQLEEAAYRCGLIPEFLVRGKEECTLDTNHLIIAKAMFRFDSFLNVFRWDGKKTEVFHYYCTKNERVVGYDDGTFDLACNIWSVQSPSSHGDILPDSLLLPRHYFYNKVEEARENRISYEYSNSKVSWDWYKIYRNSKANVVEILNDLDDVMRQKGIQLEKVHKNLLIVAGNQSICEMVGYLLTSHYLIRLKSIDHHTILITQVNPSDTSAKYLRDKYL